MFSVVLDFWTAPVCGWEQGVEVMKQTDLNSI